MAKATSTVAKAAVKKRAKVTESAANRNESNPSGLRPRELAKALLAQKTSALKWQALQTKVKQIQTAPYNMKNSYEKQTGLAHKTHGWGFIVDKKNDRLEVLFKDGIKYLISNYK